MRKNRPVLPVLFAFIMLFFVLFVVWYLPSLNDRRFSLQDVRLSIETRLGRERKQQMEYDATAAALPEVQAELDRLLPEAERPEHTEGYEGFYHLDAMNGTVEEAMMDYINKE